LDAINHGAAMDPTFKPTEYPIIDHKKSLQKKTSHKLGINKLGTNLATWWTKWVMTMSSDLFDIVTAQTESQVERATEASYLWQVVQTYICTLSSSHIRHVRHTATFVAMAICNGLANVAKQANDEARKLQDNARKLPDGGSRRRDLEQQADVFLQRAKLAEKELDSLFER
jgi:hypothetical protein